jgi:hypothetical protein
MCRPPPEFGTADTAWFIKGLPSASIAANFFNVWNPFGGRAVPGPLAASDEGPDPARRYGRKLWMSRSGDVPFWGGESHPKHPGVRRGERYATRVGAYHCVDDREPVGAAGGHAG